MGDAYPKLTVAAVQAAPIFLDREATIEKACALIREAGAHGARVVGFSEGFVPGHPLWYHFHPATGPTSRGLATRLFANAVEVPSPATEALGAAARDADAYVVMGLCERRPGTTGTLFNSQVFFGPDGRTLATHRKLTPTVGERLVHAGGYGDGIVAVKTPFGPLTGLICAENNNPLAIFAMIALGSVIHVAAWPNAPARGMLTRSDRAIMTGRSFAYQAKGYVINACGTLDDNMREVLAYAPGDREFLDEPAIAGGSSIIGPDSSVIAGPLGAEEAILYAEVDIERCVHEKVVHDFAGHYNRPDVFRFTLDRHIPTLFRVTDSADEPAHPDSRPAADGEATAAEPLKEPTLGSRA